MSARSLNKAMLIGNLTRDPELRYTPNGTAVCSFGLATNRSWTTDTGEKREEADFHKLVAWNKLAELCSQLLTKGRKVFVEGRIQTRNWQAQDGTQRTTTEIVIEDMLILDSRRVGETATVGGATTMMTPPVVSDDSVKNDDAGDKKKKKEVIEKTESVTTKATDDQTINPDDIPF